MNYGANKVESWYRAATYVDKILKGAKPADLPVAQPMKFEFVINLKTAQALDLALPRRSSSRRTKCSSKPWGRARKRPFFSDTGSPQVC
jgi:ABC-type uncharacterized transport system substrate-binding protein